MAGLWEQLHQASGHGLWRLTWVHARASHRVRLRRHSVRLLF